MTKRESQVAEFAELLKKADAEQIAWIKKCMLLFINSSGFNDAFEKATPPGEECPPADVMKALVNEWAEREGLE